MRLAYMQIMNITTVKCRADTVEHIRKNMLLKPICEQEQPKIALILSESNH